jgi:NADH:ubiquinone oxidoreductase subunit F (NADH-binding)
MPTTLPFAPPVPGRLLVPGHDLATHLSNFGPTPSIGGRLIGLTHEAGLLGRGGAGFPTARKLSAVESARGAKTVVANGTEGEPLSSKDKVLLTTAPHLVLDGLDLAADAVGARRRIVAIESGNAGVERAVRAAVAERDDRHTEVLLTPRRYVSGQESALVDRIEGGLGRPTLRRPFEAGVGGRPTLIDNVETLAHLALIARMGPDAYRPGTLLLTVTGDVTRPGVYEVPIGTNLGAVLRQAGAVTDCRGVLVGGYYGRWVRPEAVRTAVVDAGRMGCGVVSVVGDTCAVQEMARVAAWFAASSAGQCGACTWGLRDLAAATRAVADGRRGTAEIGRWTVMVAGRGACKLPDGAVAFLTSGLDVFAEEIDEHRAGRCSRVDRGHLPTPMPEAWS